MNQQIEEVSLSSLDSSLQQEVLSEISEKESLVTKKTPNIPKVHLYDLSQLPSAKKVGYPEGLTLSYRPYNFGELEQLNSQNQDQFTLIDFYKMVLQGVHSSIKDFNLLSLTYNDVLYLALLRKLSTLGGQRFTINFKHSCGEELSIKRSLSDFELDDLAAPKLPIKLTLTTGAELYFRPLTIGQWFDINTGENQSIPPSLVKLTAAQMTCEGCSTNSSEDLIKKIQIISEISDRRDVLALGKVLKFLDHGIKPITVKCKKCKQDAVIDLKEDQKNVLILPFLEDINSAEGQISFG